LDPSNYIYIDKSHGSRRHASGQLREGTKPVKTIKQGVTKTVGHKSVYMWNLY